MNDASGQGNLEEKGDEPSKWTNMMKYDEHGQMRDVRDTAK